MGLKTFSVLRSRFSVPHSLSAPFSAGNEHLGPAIDDGIIKLRQMYLREIEKVKRGEDPKCVVRDPEKNKMIVIPAYEKWVPESERNLGKTAAVA